MKKTHANTGNGFDFARGDGNRPAEQSGVGTAGTSRMHDPFSCLFSGFPPFNVGFPRNLGWTVPHRLCLDSLKHPKGLCVLFVARRKGKSWPLHSTAET